MYSLDPDLPLVRRAGAGDVRACADLVDRHLDGIVGFATRYLGNRADAEEVAQEVFLRVWRNAASWRPEGARFKTWLYRVAINLCHDRARRRGTLPLDGAAEVPSDAPSAGARVQQDQVSAQVRRALDALPERQRSAIVLCYYQDMDNKAAADVMELSVEALESLLARGRRRLRDLLAADRLDLLGDIG